MHWKEDIFGIIVQTLQTLTHICKFIIRSKKSVYPTLNQGQERIFGNLVGGKRNHDFLGRMGEISGEKITFASLAG